MFSFGKQQSRLWSCLQGVSSVFCCFTLHLMKGRTIETFSRSKAVSSFATSKLSLFDVIRRRGVLGLSFGLKNFKSVCWPCTSATSWLTTFPPWGLSKFPKWRIGGRQEPSVGNLSPINRAVFCKTTWQWKSCSPVQDLLPLLILKRKVLHNTYATATRQYAMKPIS